MNEVPQIKWLLIDIGDVLLLKDRHLGKSFGQLLASELGVDDALAQEINKEHYTTMEDTFISEEVFMKNLAERLGYTAPKNIFSLFRNAYRQQVKANSNLMDFLDEVRLQGIKTAVLSNTIAIYQPIQEELGINVNKGFDPIIYSWQVEMVKPHKEIFEYALTTLNARAEEVLFVDDKVGHLEGARQVGIKTVLFDSNDSVIATLREQLGMQS